MANNRLVIIPAVILGIALLVVAVIYFLDTASALPSFFPGHASAPTHHHHAKHGIAALVVALGCFVFAWFRAGPRREPAL